jgi:hypothetical protein
MKHSLYIFEHLYNDLPPLVPEEIKQEMENSLIEWKNKSEVLPNELEEAVIKYGKKTWPHRRAFHELIEKYRAKLGEIFLRRKITKEIENRYEEFLAHGGNFEGLSLGRPMGFFQPEERIMLTQSLVDTTEDIKKQAWQAALSVERNWYETRIEEFIAKLNEIEEKIGEMRQVMADLGENSDLAEEMQEHILALEQGLSLLGSRTRWDQLENAGDYFAERQQEKNILKY